MWCCQNREGKSPSGLTATIDGPTDDLKIELSWNGGKPYVEEINTGGDVAPVGTDQPGE